MPYATQSDLAARLAPDVLQALADDDGDTLPDDAILDGALADAASEINHRLAARYATPLDPAPGITRRWCVDLAVAALYLRRSQPIPAGHAAAADLTRRALAAIADGLSGLAGAQPRLEDFETDNTRLGEEPIFSPEALEFY